MNYLDTLRAQFNGRVSFQRKRPQVLQLLAPLFHEDGDMVDIFLEEQENGSGKMRITDHGLTLMRLSYSYDIDTPNKQRIFERILNENRVQEDNGCLSIVTDVKDIYPAVLQFAQTIAKVANMQLYKREVIESLFFEQLTEFIEDSLGAYSPQPQVLPIPERDDLEVDFKFPISVRPIYLFGVRDNSQARLATISCLQFQLAQLLFKSAVVHEDFEKLSKKDRVRITNAVDKQFTSLESFRADARSYFSREAAA